MIRCGVARVDISPPLGVPLAGYPFVSRPCRGVHDPLYASVVVYDAGEGPAVIAALDVLAVGGPLVGAVRERARRDYGLAHDHVLVCATHTHSAPALPLGPAADPVVYGVADAGYASLVAARVGDAIGVALYTRRVAAVSMARSPAEAVTANRRRLGGVADARVTALSARGGDGAPIAHLLGFGCHPTVLQAENDLASSDFPGEARAVVERSIGGVVVYTTGAAGDQSTRHTRHAPTFDEAERLGRVVGEAALRAVGEAVLVDAGSVRVGRRAVSVPLRGLPSPADADDALRLAESRLEALRAAGAPAADTRTAEVVLLGARHNARLAGTAPRGPSQVSSEVQVLAVGDVRIVGLPVEWFAEDGLALADAPFPVIVVAYANDMLGYAPPRAAYDEGGYEPTATLLAPEARDLIMDEARSLMRAV